MVTHVDVPGVAPEGAEAVPSRPCRPVPCAPLPGLVLHGRTTIIRVVLSGVLWEILAKD